MTETDGPNQVYEELQLLDSFLGLPTGTSRSVIADCDPDQLERINRELLKHGLRLDDDLTVPGDCRAAWAELMSQLGISRAWWMDGDPSVGLDNKIRSL